MIVLGIVAVAVLLMLLGASQSGQPMARPDGPSPHWEEQPLDQLELLTRYGTPDDAARLISQGVDVAALGYRPSDGE